MKARTQRSIAAGAVGLLAAAGLVLVGRQTSNLTASSPTTETSTSLLQLGSTCTKTDPLATGPISCIPRRLPANFKFPPSITCTTISATDPYSCPPTEHEALLACLLDSACTRPEAKTSQANGVWDDDPAAWQEDPQIGPYTVGTPFWFDYEAYVVGVRYYKFADTSATFASLWAPGGTEIQRTAFGAQTETGWQEAFFSDGMWLWPGKTYVVSVSLPNGHAAMWNAQDPAYAGIRQPPLHELGHGVSSATGTPTFPESFDTGVGWYVEPIVIWWPYAGLPVAPPSTTTTTGVTPTSPPEPSTTTTVPPSTTTTAPGATVALGTYCGDNNVGAQAKTATGASAVCAATSKSGVKYDHPRWRSP